MEKLQAAIAEARSRRGNQPAPAAPPAQAAAPACPAGDDPWLALDEIRLATDRLALTRVFSASANQSATPFDVLRTKILYQMQQNGWKRLAITSPLPSCGRTTTACNLALGLSRQPELRTILFDFDLRSPAVARTLALSDPNPITPLLTGQRNFAEHAHRVGGNLAVALSGMPENDPTRVLMSNSASELLDGVQRDYNPNIMIFDLPSILVGDDARAFLQHVDCALIIARADQTRYGDFDSCEREVGEYTNVLGVVLNGYRYGSWGNGDAA